MILQCPLFQGLPPDALDYALSYFEAHVKAYEKGDFLHQVSFPLERFGLVLSGTIQVSMDDMDGHHIIMNNVSAGGLFGEAYCFLGTDAPIYICAVTEAEVLWMRPYPGQGAPPPPLQERDQMLANRFVAALASRTLSLNQRIQILSRRTQRRRNSSPSCPNTPRPRGTRLPSPSTGPAWPISWGPTRGALSRELSHLRKEGVLDYHRNQFRILK